METPEKAILVAERLFAEQGYDGTTLRQITRAAGVNLAAVHYHHGAKQDFYLEILRRRLRPLNAARLARLDEAERQAGAGPVPLDRLAAIMAGPLFALHAEPAGQAAARLLGRSLSEPLPFMEQFLAEEFQPVMARFGQALRRHAPGLPPEEFLWRLNFVVGAMLHTLATLHRMKALTRGICRDDDHAGALRRFIEFSRLAFAPAAAGSCVSSAANPAAPEDC